MLTRRTLLLSTGVVPLAKLVGCSSSSMGMPDTFVPPVDTDLGSGDSCGPAATAWATGGTAAMTAKACYPDPFAGVATCALVCSTTAGPCTAPVTERQDVSEAMPGLPMRLALKIVNPDSCAPIAGAIVEIWHTQRSGVYSGQTPSPGFCSVTPRLRRRATSAARRPRMQTAGSTSTRAFRAGIRGAAFTSTFASPSAPATMS